MNERRPLRLFTDRRYVHDDDWHVPILNLFWGHGAVPMGRADFADRYAARGGKFFELVDLDAADLAIWPVDWKRIRTKPERIEELQRFAADAKASGVPTVVFYVGDYDDVIPIDDAFVFRTSMIRSRRRPGEFALTGFHDDLLEYLDGDLSTRAKTAMPIVSFCGFVFYEDRPRTLRGRLHRRAVAAKRSVLERLDLPADQDVYVRARAIDALLHQRRHVRPEIVLRSQGGGGGQTDPLSVAFRSWNEVRREYVRSIVESDYVLCTRGIGNWSYRLYETLCLGRIPVFVDTDCVLPYDFAVDWREHVVWLRRTEVDRIGEIVAEFHESLSDVEFAERQRACRKLWEDWVSPEGFFANFHRHFSLT